MTTFKFCLIMIPVLLATSCMQLETPYTFIEEEDVKARSKNLYRYYKDLEEEILLGMNQIRLLRQVLQMKIVEEKTLSEEIENKGNTVTQLKKDTDVLKNEITAQEKVLGSAREKRQKVEGTLQCGEGQDRGNREEYRPGGGAHG